MKRLNRVEQGDDPAIPGKKLVSPAKPVIIRKMIETINKHRTLRLRLNRTLYLAKLTNRKMKRSSLLRTQQQLNAVVSCSVLVLLPRLLTIALLSVEESLHGVLQMFIAFVKLYIKLSEGKQLVTHISTLGKKCIAVR
ncbi:MAG: hypothetical protein HGB35_08200 [Geobacteraceae bacterium]|nr:hypothetical protein [Geobacteraceae bacterium]